MNAEHTDDEELLLEQELSEMVLPLTDAEIEAALENEVKSILEQDYQDKLQTLNIKREVVEDVERLSVSFRHPRGEDVYDYLTEEEKVAYYDECKSLIKYIAKGFESPYYSIPLDELESYALIGFVKALNAYKLSCTAGFKTFATHCIKNELKNAVMHEKKRQDGIAYSLDDEIVVAQNSGSLFTIRRGDLMPDAEFDLESVVQNNLKLEILNEILADLDQYFSDKDIFILKSYYELDGFTKRTQSELCMMFHSTQPAIAARIKKICSDLQLIFKNKEKEFYMSKK